MNFCNLKFCLFIILLLIGIISLIFGILAFFSVPNVIDRIVKEVCFFINFIILNFKQTYLGKDKNGTDNIVLKMFRDPPYDIKLQIWTFSTKNVDDVMKKRKKPILEEKGPYTFRFIFYINIFYFFSLVF
jgi:hypothetical protein